MNKESKKLSGLLGDSVDKKRKQQLEVFIFGVKTSIVQKAQDERPRST